MVKNSAVMQIQTEKLSKELHCKDLYVASLHYLKTIVALLEPGKYWQMNHLSSAALINNLKKGSPYFPNLVFL